MKGIQRGVLKRFLRDAMISVGILALTTFVGIMLQGLEQSNYYMSMIFVLAVFLIARMTDGYLCGIFSSLISVLLVNFLFTYPYFRFNFTLAGYPIAIISMLAVSVTTSALTTKAKYSAEIRLEAEREKTRSNLLRAVSHDLRTPLTGILGASSAILENDDTLTKEERMSLLQDVRDDAQWLIRMVENLLTITRMDEFGGAKVVKTPEPAEEIMETAVAKFRKQTPQIKVSVQVPEAFLLIPMDAVLVEQVLINLLVNVEHHAKGADHIWISLQQEGRFGVYTVQDNGCGIDTAILPQLFQGHLPSEFSGDKSRNMGIGLSVCSTIVKAHNGTLTAKNRPEGGAEFRVSLPLEENV